MKHCIDNLWIILLSHPINKDQVKRKTELRILFACANHYWKVVDHNVGGGGTTNHRKLIELLLCWHSQVLDLNNGFIAIYGFYLNFCPTFQQSYRLY